MVYMAYNFDIVSVASPSNTLNDTYEDYIHNYDSNNYDSAITPGWEYAWCPDDATGSINPIGWEYDLYNNVLNNIDKHKASNNNIQHYKAIKIQRAWKKYITKKKSLPSTKNFNTYYIEHNLVPAFQENLITDTQFWNTINEFTNSLDMANISALEKLRLYKKLNEIRFNIHPYEYSIVSDHTLKSAQERFLKF